MPNLFSHLERKVFRAFFSFLKSIIIPFILIFPIKRRDSLGWFNFICNDCKLCNFETRKLSSRFVTLPFYNLRTNFDIVLSSWLYITKLCNFCPWNALLEIYKKNKAILQKYSKLSQLFITFSITTFCGKTCLIIYCKIYFVNKRFFSSSSITITPKPTGFSFVLFNTPWSRSLNWFILL